jgi:hypothetical protein
MFGTPNKIGFGAAGQSECDWICQAAVHLAQEGPLMNRFLTVSFCAALIIAAAANAASPSLDLIAQVHFAGGEQISADTNSLVFTNLWRSPEAQALREQTLNRLAHAPFKLLSGRMSPQATDRAGQLRPLFDDLSQSEWFLNVRDATNGSPEFALVIHLDSDRARLWQTNLESVLESWTGLSAEKNRDGWELKKHLPPNLIRFVRAGDWVVFGWGQDELLLNDGLVRRVLAEKRPAPIAKNYWLSADVNWARLARGFSLSVATNFPETQFEVVGRSNNLRFEGKFIFSQPPALSLKPWRMPTNTIHEPFVSFAAVRGFAPWLEKQGWAQPFEIQPLPDQAFVWALAQIPFQTFVAVPVENATNAIQQLGAKLAVGPHTNLQNPFLPSFTVTTNDNRIAWRGLPFIAPILQPVREPAGDFLLAGLFPNSPNPSPLPPELLAQLDHTNLIFYHWEITAERLPEVRSLSQLALLLAGRPQFSAQSAAAKWLDHIGPTLGNTVTEITQTAPDEWTFKRKAPGGLTAFELVALANWLETTNFPCCNLRLSPHPENPVVP